MRHIESLESRQMLSVSPSAGGVVIFETANTPFTANLGNLHFRTVDEVANVVINWGDGTTGTGSLNGSFATGNYKIQGSHTYDHSGIFAVNVKVFESPIGSTIKPTSPALDITDAIIARPLKPGAGGVSLNETAGKRFTAAVAHFNFKNVDELLTAVIYWGDGSHSAGTLDGSFVTGKYQIDGTHTYAKAGTYRITVKLFSKPAGSPLPPGSPEVFVSVAHVV